MGYAHRKGEKSGKCHSKMLTIEQPISYDAQGIAVTACVHLADAICSTTMAARLDGGLGDNPNGGEFDAYFLAWCRGPACRHDDCFRCQRG
jgi:hypothetical protein